MAKKDNRAEKTMSASEKKEQIKEAKVRVAKLIVDGKKIGEEKEFLPELDMKEWCGGCKRLAEVLVDLIPKQKILLKQLADGPSEKDINKPASLTTMLQCVAEAKTFLDAEEEKLDNQITKAKNLLAELIRDGNELDRKMKDWFGKYADLAEDLAGLIPERQNVLDDLNKVKCPETMVGALIALQTADSRLKKEGESRA